MKLHFFDRCRPLVSHSGMYHFHFHMFHGRVTRANDGTFDLVRNVFLEPPIIYPSPVLAMNEALAGSVSTKCGIVPRGLRQDYTFYVPFELGQPEPPEFTQVAPWVEREMDKRNRRLLKPAAPPRQTYMAIEPLHWHQVPVLKTAKVVGRDLFNGWDNVEAEVVSDATFVQEHGLILTKLGVQASREVMEVLEPYLSTPWFHVAELDI